jgi:hypothetical protein
VSTTADFMALREAWAGETQVIPCVALEVRVLEARKGRQDAEAMAESFRFSAWLNTLRAAVDREEEAHREWAKAVATGMWRFGAGEGA